MTTRLAVMGYLSIDTIEAGNARHQSLPGGGALYAALGAALSGVVVELHATVGEDFPAEWLAALAALGIDTAKVLRGQGASRRARLAYAAGDRRRSPHHADPAWWDSTNRLAPRMPADWSGLAGLMLAPMPISTLHAAVAEAAWRGVPSVVDTSVAFAMPDPTRLLGVLPQVTMFAPSIEETRALFPALDHDHAARSMAAFGCAVLHKRGPDGAVLLAGDLPEPLHLPAPPVVVADPTGAGDATVGALAAGLARGMALPDAARAALLAGARACEAIGPAGLGFVP